MDTVVLFKALTENEEGDNYVDYFAEHDVKAQIISPIIFQFRSDTKLYQCLKDFKNYSGLILTSPRCVHAVKKVLESRSMDLSIRPTFVVGEATDSLSKDLGLKTDGKDCGDALNLAEYIATFDLTGPLIYPKGNLARDTLQNKLDSLNISVKPIVVYETTPNPDLHEAVKHIQKILPARLIFFSPSGVESVLPILNENGVNLTEQKFYAIGRTTEKSLADHNIVVSGTAQKPNPEALLKAVLFSR